MEKKNPYIMTIGFKKEDPDHIYVAELLNSMGRGKAQYIVKAVLAYQNRKQNGEILQPIGVMCRSQNRKKRMICCKDLMKMR